jgi:hypothetical protein
VANQWVNESPSPLEEKEVGRSKEEEELSGLIFLSVL